MPLFFLLAGLILLVTGVNGTTAQAGALLKRDFTGPNNFFAWLFAILFAGSIGYIPTLKPLSIAFLVLIFVSILLTSGSGFFDKLQAAMRQFQSGDIGQGGGTGSNFELPSLSDFDLSLPDLGSNDGNTYSI